MPWSEALPPGMDAHRIGQQLRAVVLRERQDGRPLDPRRLQALIGDLCADGNVDLVAPLRYLVLSGAFASAAGMDPPLADGRHLPRLQSELAQMYADGLCARLQPLLEGLLGLPQSAVAQGPTTSPGGAHGSAPPRSGAGTSLLIALLALLSGALLLAVAGVGLLLWQRQGGILPWQAESATGAAGTGTPGAQMSQQSGNGLPQTTPAPEHQARQPSPSLPDPTDANAPVDRAVASIQELYGALSAKDFSRAEALYGHAAADQFTPSFFRQFERVSVQDLRATGQVGSTLNLEGVVTFVWPDGSLQSETRSFSVDTSESPAVISGSEFGRVLMPRR